MTTTFVPFVNNYLADVLALLAQARQSSATTWYFSTDSNAEVAAILNALQSAETLTPVTGTASTTALVGTAQLPRYLRHESTTEHKLYLSRTDWENLLIGLANRAATTARSDAEAQTLRLLAAAQPTHSIFGAGEVMCVNATSQADLDALWTQLQQKNLVDTTQVVSTTTLTAVPGNLSELANTLTSLGGSASAGYLAVQSNLDESNRYSTYGIVLHEDGTHHDLYLSRAHWAILSAHNVIFLAGATLLAGATELTDSNGHPIGIMKISKATAEELTILKLVLLYQGRAKAAQFITVSGSYSAPQSLTAFNQYIQSNVVDNTAFPNGEAAQLYMTSQARTALINATLGVSTAWLGDAANKITQLKTWLGSATPDSAGRMQLLISASDLPKWQTFLSSDALLKNPFVDGVGVLKKSGATLSGYLAATLAPGAILEVKIGDTVYSSAVGSTNLITLNGTEWQIIGLTTGDYAGVTVTQVSGETRTTLEVFNLSVDTALTQMQLWVTQSTVQQWVAQGGIDFPKAVATLLQGVLGRLQNSNTLDIIDLTPLRDLLNNTAVNNLLAAQGVHLGAANGDLGSKTNAEKIAAYGKLYNDGSNLAATRETVQAWVQQLEQGGGYDAFPSNQPTVYNGWATPPAVLLNSAQRSTLETEYSELNTLTEKLKSIKPTVVTQSIQLDLALVNGTATGGGVDFGSADATKNLEISSDGGLTWQAATRATLTASQDILVRTPVVKDSTAETDETFSLSATQTTNTSTAASNTTASAQITLTDNSYPHLRVSSPSVREDAGYAIFTLTLDQASSSEIKLDLALANGTATGGGVDYGSADTTQNLQMSTDNGTTWVAVNATTPQVSFAVGTTSVLVRTPVIRDSNTETAETFSLTATRSTTSAGQLANSSASGTATILEATYPSFTVSAESVGQSVGKTTFIVAFDGTRIQDTTLTLAFTPNSLTLSNYQISDDYGNTWRTLSVSNNSASVTLGKFRKELWVRSDFSGYPAANANTTAGLQVSVDNSTIKQTSNNNAIGNVTIWRNGTTPQVFVDDVKIRDDAPTAYFTVKLSGPSTVPITVDYSTVDGSAINGSDYLHAVGKLTFAAGETSQIIEVPLLNGRAYRASDSSFTLNLQNPLNATLGDGTAQATLQGAKPSILVSSDYAQEGSGTRYAQFIVGLSRISNQATKLNLNLLAGSATAGNDYVNGLEFSTDGSTWTSLSNNTLILAANQSYARVRVALQDRGASGREADEQFTLQANLASDSATQTQNTQASGSATLFGNAPQFTLTPNTPSVSEDAGYATFRLSMNGEQWVDVSSITDSSGQVISLATLAQQAEVPQQAWLTRQVIDNTGASKTVIAQAQLTSLQAALQQRQTLEALTLRVDDLVKARDQVTRITANGQTW